jgi:catechol 2,3-dioxygenase-like lactoylglutathione lyase family enzyme
VPLTVGINHVTASTADLDRLVRFYFEMFDAQKVFEGAATADYARMAIVDLGGSRYLKVVEDLAGSAGSAARTPTPHAATERFGLAVGSHSALRDLRERMIGAGAEIGEIERLPTQWVLHFTDPDGTPLQVCAHAQPGDVAF